MAKKARTAEDKGLRKKSSFGTCYAEYINPSPQDERRTGINIHISFEEALKLQLALGQALAQLNSYDRSTKEGKRTCINMCLFPKHKYITVTETKLRTKK